MLAFILAGLALGSVYALLAGGVVISYVATGVLNFSFGALAYFIARLFYFLYVQHGWGLAVSAIVAIGVCGPLIGLLLWAVLFRSISGTSPLIKIVVTIGLLVAIPPIASLLFGDQQIGSAPGLAPQPVATFQVLGTYVTMDQLITYGCLIAAVGIGGVILRYTGAGLSVRALVDSQTMTALSGTSPALVSLSVWMIVSGIAGLAGVLAAPIIGLSPGDYTILLVGAFAAVIAGRLTSAAIAIPVALLIGVAGGLAERYLPSSSTFTAAVVPSIPFLFIAVCMTYRVLRYRVVGTVTERLSLGLAQSPAAGADGTMAPPSRRRLAGGNAWSRIAGAVERSVSGPILLVALVVVLATATLGDFWVSTIGYGVALGVAFLSFTLVTGEGGMIWLCQITLAGVGAIVAAQAALHAHAPVLAAIFLGGCVAAVVGGLLALMTIRIGDLYLPLVTITFALLVENLVFTLPAFENYGEGVNFGRPDFASSDRGFVYLALGCFLILTIALRRLRHSTAGIALTAVRASPEAAQSLGLNITRMKITVAVAGAFVAGVGGGLLASYAGSALPDSYDTLTGVVWFAVLVTFGSRSHLAALLAGLTFTLSAALVSRYLQVQYAEVPPALFGLGAIAVIRNPDGIVAMNARQFTAVMRRVRKRRAGASAVLSAEGPAASRLPLPQETPVPDAGGPGHV
jgi:branched-chain amino acid transport system permease protein